MLCEQLGEENNLIFLHGLEAGRDSLWVLGDG